MSWLLLYLAISKVNSLWELADYHLGLIRDRDHVIDHLRNAPSNINELSEVEYRLYQKAIPLLIKSNPELLEKFYMDIRVLENDTSWVIELYSPRLTGRGQAILIDKETEEVLDTLETR